ncbi:MAG: HIT family protein [Candidatus Woesearchaeota archaeon]
MNDCIFCKIVKGELPCTKVYEDDNVLAFLDISPVHPGHALVILKKHYETITDIPDNKILPLMHVLQKVCKAVKIGVDSQGYNIIMNNYKAAGQLVPHAHFHIIPRFDGDGLKHWPQTKYQEGQAEKVRKKIIDKI